MKALVLSLALLQATAASGLTGTESTIACSYETSAGDPETAELQARGNHACMRNGGVFVDDSALKELRFSDKGLAVLFAEHHGWLLVKRDGSTIPTPAFDNGPDAFSEGLDTKYF